MSERSTNKITLAQFRNMMQESVDEIPLDQLYELQAEVAYNKRDAADLAARLKNAILRRCEDAGRGALKALHKDTGSATIKSDDAAFNYKFEVPKKVEWDQAKLLRVVENFAKDGKTFAQILEYVNVSFSVSETKYNAWPSEIRAIFQDARMVKDAPATAEIVEAKRK